MVDRQLLGYGQYSLTTKPETWGFCDSKSDGFDAVVANEWIGHGYDLAVIRRICEDFLIPRHAGVEDHFPSHSTSAPKDLPLKMLPSSSARIASMNIAP